MLFGNGVARSKINAQSFEPPGEWKLIEVDASQRRNEEKNGPSGGRNLGGQSKLEERNREGGHKGVHHGSFS